MGDEWSMTELNEYIGITKQFEGQVTGTVTGIATDDDRESLAGKGFRDAGCPSLQSCGELEGNNTGVPFPQRSDEIRNIGQSHAPCR